MKNNYVPFPSLVNNYWIPEENKTVSGDHESKSNGEIDFWAQITGFYIYHKNYKNDWCLKINVINFVNNKTISY